MLKIHLNALFEASTETGKTSDVTIWLNDGSTIDFEAATLGETSENIKLLKFYNSFQHDLARIQFEYSVTIQGKVFGVFGVFQAQVWTCSKHFRSKDVVLGDSTIPTTELWPIS